MKLISYPNGTKGHMFSALLVMVILVGGYYAIGSLTSTNPNVVCPLGYQAIPTYSPTTGVATGADACASLTVTIDHQEQTTANPELIAEGFTPSCYINCHGIIYTLDPTVLITNGGHDFEQYKIYGTAGSITGTSTDYATVIGLSESGSGPTVSDYSASGGCKTTSPANQLLTGGLADAIGTVSAGVASSTTTTQIYHTFTAAETDNTVQLACLQTEIATSSNVIVYAEGTFGPDSLTSGNTITITWAIART